MICRTTLFRRKPSVRLWLTLSTIIVLIFFYKIITWKLAVGCLLLVPMKHWCDWSAPRGSKNFRRIRGSTSTSVLGQFCSRSLSWGHLPKDRSDLALRSFAQSLRSRDIIASPPSKAASWARFRIIANEKACRLYAIQNNDSKFPSTVQKSICH